jgi:hypothetical protein
MSIYFERFDAGKFKWSQEFATKNSSNIKAKNEMKDESGCMRNGEEDRKKKLITRRGSVWTIPSTVWYSSKAGDVIAIGSSVSACSAHRLRGFSARREEQLGQGICASSSITANIRSQSRMRMRVRMLM